MNISEDTVELQNEVSDDEIKALWVFAYGSLCWKPGFKFHKAITGHVKGYQRRFWQGNTTHRGTEERVSSLKAVFTFFVKKKCVLYTIFFYKN